MTRVPGVAVGHWSDEVARTGCSVVLFPEGAVASGEVRGGAPATREWELLAPERMMSRIDAVVLSGGSAFGLAACDGVVRWCEERGRGFPTTAGVVPIVVGLAVYDLDVGDASVRPGPGEGYAACEAASEVAGTNPRPGRGVGAGCGATIGSWRGRDAARPGGLGVTAEHQGELVVSAIVVVNCYGDVLEPGADPLPFPAGAFDPGVPFGSPPGENTTVGVVVTNAALSKTQCLLVAQSAHDGLARAVDPVHTLVDGDAFVAASAGGVGAPVDLVRTLAARAICAAVRVAGLP